MRKIVFAALCAFAAVAVSCKNDRESDVNPGDSDIDGLYINEVYSCNPDWVELYNAGNEELHIGGFILQDDKGAEEEYVIPEGTTIGAGEFLVLEEFSFGISSSKGDRVTLLDASRNVVDDVMLPVMEDGSSYGRRSDGGSEFAAFTAPTKGRSNTGGGDPFRNRNLRMRRCISTRCCRLPRAMTWISSSSITAARRMPISEDSFCRTIRGLPKSS